MNCEHGLNIKTHELKIHKYYTYTKSETGERYDGVTLPIKKSIKHKGVEEIKESYVAAKIKTQTSR